MAYRTSVITFLDILGFREIIKTQGADDIGSMLDAITEKAAAPGEGEKIRTEVLTFSDSIIRVRPSSPKLQAIDLLHEIRELAAAQWSLWEHEILVRGGMTIGLCSTSPGRVFGPGFVRAYELESSLASTPRVVIDPVIVETIREYIATGANLGERQRLTTEFKDHMQLGSDGIWFVDYIGSAAKILPSEEAHRSALKRYRNTIIEKTNELRKDSLVLPKYLWLVRYHNSSAKRLYPTDKSLEIKRTDVPLSDELLKPTLKFSAGRGIFKVQQTQKSDSADEI